MRTVLPLFALLLSGLAATPALAADAPGTELFDGCSWSAADLSLPSGQHVKFRYQACEDEDMKVSYRIEGDGTIIEDGAGGPYPVMQIWPLGGKTPETFLTDLLAQDAPPDSGKCVAKTLPPESYSLSDLWQITPTEAYQKELDATGEPWTACGSHGLSNDSVQFFRKQDGAMVFYAIGQEPPFFDVSSLTITTP